MPITRKAPIRSSRKDEVCHGKEYDARPIPDEPLPRVYCNDVTEELRAPDWADVNEP